MEIVFSDKQFLMKIIVYIEKYNNEYNNQANIFIRENFDFITQLVFDLKF